MVDYREIAPPESLRHLVKAAWSLSVPEGAEWVTHVATPDGCMELIRRLSGRSQWNGEQPSTFVAGMISRPAKLRLSAGSCFVGLRLWPWTWRALSGRAPAELIDRWADLALAAPSIAMPDDIGGCFGSIDSGLIPSASAEIARAALDCRSSCELSRRTNISPRSLQRWFARHVGAAPRTYFRMLRFSEAFAELPNASVNLAAHAADHGFADQAHMAREFRALAGTPAVRAKPRGRGPFLAGS